MGYNPSTFIYLEITFGFWTPVPPYRVSKKIFFEIYFLNMARTNKSTMLITNIVISNYKNVVLKN